MASESKSEPLSNVIQKKPLPKQKRHSKFESLQMFLKQATFTFPDLSKEDLIKKACVRYNETTITKGISEPLTSGLKADENSDPSFLEKISVDFLRSHLAVIEERLPVAFGKATVRKGRREIQQKILSEIAKNFPWLEAECKRQEKHL